MPEPLLLEAPDLPIAWKTLVPAYESAQYRPLVVQINTWDSKYAEAIEGISLKRSNSRWNNYVDPAEIDRVHLKMKSKDKVAVRFGVSKTGHGYHGERGDFCMVGAAIEGAAERKRLTVFYRSLELIGGFAYDLTLFRRLGVALECDWKSLTIMAATANVFAVKKNSNEKLYPKLWSIFSE